eukprot:7297820-Prymnesium_polylepis.1
MSMSSNDRPTPPDSRSAADGCLGELPGAVLRLRERCLQMLEIAEVLQPSHAHHASALHPELHHHVNREALGL